MRAFEKGKPFLHVEAEFTHSPENCKTWGNEPGVAYPVFSEAHLYPLLGKDDARFVLAVVSEYAALIELLGEAKVREMLDSPRGREAEGAAEREADRVYEASYQRQKQQKRRYDERQERRERRNA